MVSSIPDRGSSKDRHRSKKQPGGMYIRQVTGISGRESFK